MVRVLKCINQEVLAPPVLKMKMEIHKHLAYKDVRGHWTVSVRLKADDWIYVTHMKREQSHDATPENHFEFTWCFVRGAFRSFSIRS